MIEESQGLMLAKQLANEGCRVHVYDPAAMANAKSSLGGLVTYSESIQACAGEASVLVIATPWKDFLALRPEHMKRSGERPVLIDWWGMLPKAEFEAVAEYIACGAWRGATCAKRRHASSPKPSLPTNEGVIF